MSAGTNPRFAWPIVIDATNDQFTITEGGGGHLVVDIPDNTPAIPAYYWRGDGTAADMCFVLKTALEAVGALNYTVTLATTGILTIDADGAWLLHFAVAHDFPASLLGMTDADHASGAGDAVVGTFHVGYAWLVQQMVIEDSEDLEVSQAIPTLLEGGRGRVAMYGDHYERLILIDALPNGETMVAAEVLAQRSFQRFYRYARTGGRFEYCPNSAVPGTYTSRQVLDRAWLQRFPASRTPRTIQRWDVPIPMSLLVP